MHQVKTEDLIRYEEDLLTDAEEVVFFQALIDSGMAWTLQGHYGRVATQLIRDGLCQPGAQSPAGPASGTA